MVLVSVYVFFQTVNKYHNKYLSAYTILNPLAKAIHWLMKLALGHMPKSTKHTTVETYFFQYFAYPSDFYIQNVLHLLFA